MSGVSRMALLLALVAGCLQPASATGALHSLRGHHKHGGALTSSQEQRKETTPLYDDFLAIMNSAAGKALKEQKGVPTFDDFLKEVQTGADKAHKDKAYDDFLNIMHAGATKAHGELTRSRSYDEFLGLMKQKAEEAYHQQVELPSYDDFLVALKQSGTEALKKPTPRYDEFLAALKDGAEKAMQKRVFHELSDDTIRKLEAHHRQNPLEKMNKDLKKLGRQMQGKPAERKKDNEDSKLRREIRKLQEKQRQHEAEGNHKAKKPLMKRINVLRTQLCWKRPNLWEHEKCMRFLGLHCMQESTGEGICRKFAEKAQEKCETSDNEEFREDYCALGEALGETVLDDEEVDEDQEVEGLTDDSEGTDDEVVEDEEELSEHLDEELDEDLEEMDEELGEDSNAAGDADAKGSANAKTKDRDGDGITDDQDAFADDPNEWKDTDKDGVGDNADSDRDGDGHDNAIDVFPDDKNEWADSDHDQIGDNADKDQDNDGVENGKDKFPLDPTEWMDSDGDGVGDNKDAYPYNPNCHSPTEPCTNITKSGSPKKGSPADPTTLDMSSERKLPDQGYSETMSGAPVNHDNYYTWVSDWQDEFPEMDQSEKITMAKICREHPLNIWCRRFKNHDAHFR